MIVSKLPDMIGAPTCLEVLLCSVPRNLPHAIFFIVSCRRRFQQDASLLSDGLFIIPKIPNVIGGSLNFLEVLLHDCEQRTGKSDHCHLFLSSRYGEGVDGLLTFSSTVFLVFPSFFMLCEDERSK